MKSTKMSQTQMAAQIYGYCNQTVFLNKGEDRFIFLAAMRLSSFIYSVPH